MFLRTSSLKRLNSFRAAENIPCCVKKDTSLKFQFVVCNWWDCHNIGKQYNSLSSLWAIRLYSSHACRMAGRSASRLVCGIFQIAFFLFLCVTTKKSCTRCEISKQVLCISIVCYFFEGGILPLKCKKWIAKQYMLCHPSEFPVSHRSVISSMGTLCVRT